MYFYFIVYFIKYKYVFNAILHSNSSNQHLRSAYITHFFILHTFKNDKIIKHLVELELFAMYFTTINLHILLFHLKLFLISVNNHLNS